MNLTDYNLTFINTFGIWQHKLTLTDMERTRLINKLLELLSGFCELRDDVLFVVSGDAQFLLQGLHIFLELEYTPDEFC